MKKPNLFVAGVARCGTTSLHNYLDQHPDIFMSTVKEPRYFSKDSFTHAYYGEVHDKTVADLDAYLNLFSGAKDEKVLGEASPNYFYHPEAPKRLKEFNPDAKIIVMVRNPIARSFSNYMLRVNLGKEPLSFEKAVDAEIKDLDSIWDGQRHYIRMGFYGQCYKRYLSYFPASQMRIYFNEDLQKDPLTFMKNAYEFLEVDNSFVPKTDFTFQKSGLPKSKILHKVSRLRYLKKVANALLGEKAKQKIKTGIREQLYERPEISEIAKAKLIQVYKKDVELFQGLVNRDLSHWLK